MPLTPEHHQQLHSLREWARKQQTAPAVQRTQPATQPPKEEEKKPETQ
jgi:hypothetical protein